MRRVFGLFSAHCCIVYFLDIGYIFEQSGLSAGKCNTGSLFTEDC